MSIYTSEKVMPYVYMCIHKTTKQFYIGSRVKNVKLGNFSHLDFPKYKTSSKFVKPIFEEFDWYIVAEFFDAIDAYNFEQKLIYENFNDELILNKYYFDERIIFSTIGVSRSHTSDTKRKMSISQTGRTHTRETKELMSKSAKGISKSKDAIWKQIKSLTKYYETNSSAFKGKTHSYESNLKQFKTKTYFYCYKDFIIFGERGLRKFALNFGIICNKMFFEVLTRYKYDDFDEDIKSKIQDSHKNEEKWFNNLKNLNT